MSTKSDKKSENRNAFRVTIPEGSISADFEIKNVNGETISISCQIMDISAGGMGFIASQPLPVGSEVYGTITIAKYSPIDVSAVIKGTREKVTNKTKTITLTTCQFTGLNAALDQKLSSLVSDCHRQIFMRQSKR